MLLGGALLAVAAVVTQLWLPSIAADNLKTSLSRNGQRVRVHVSAFPALELLFGQADSVDVTIGKLVSRGHHVGSLLGRAANVGTLTAHVAELDTHGLVLTNVALVKRDNSLRGTASVTRSAVQTALPLHLTVTPDQPATNGLLVRGQVTILGHHVAVTADLHADNGKIVLSPHLSGIGAVIGSVHVTVFSDPAVWVDRAGAVVRGSSYDLSAAAHYK